MTVGFQNDAFYAFYHHHSDDTYDDIYTHDTIIRYPTIDYFTHTTQLDDTGLLRSQNHGGVREFICGVLSCFYTTRKHRNRSVVLTTCDVCGRHNRPYVLLVAKNRARCCVVVIVEKRQNRSDVETELRLGGPRLRFQRQVKSITATRRLRLLPLASSLRCLWNKH